MKEARMTIRSTTLLAVALVCALGRAAGADPAADAKALGDKFGAAVAAGDVGAVLALYTDDAWVIYPGQDDEAHGKAAIETMLKRLIGTMQSTPLVQKSSDAIAIDATHILNVGRWEMSVGQPGHTHRTLTVRTTELLVNDNGTWRYRVDHASVGMPPPPEEKSRGRSPHRRR
jgi:uncharacterized protein (TIGR02246 family)